MRMSPIDALAGRLLDFSLSSDVAVHQRGFPMDAVGTDYNTTANVSNWGHAELLYVGYTGAAAMTPGSVCQIDKDFRVALTAAAASEINLGKPLYVSLTNFAIGSVTEQYGWVLRRGICPVQFSVAATVGPVFLGTAGKLTPTAAAGGQLLNARTLIAAVSTFTRTGATLSGSSIVKFGNVSGMYVGQAISGTGIPASSVISAINPDGTSVLIGSAIGTLVTATATGSVTVTLTNTGFGIVQLDRAFSQGQIT
jgi:hypothetical protein